jgi:hypothetical protein
MPLLHCLDLTAGPALAEHRRDHLRGGIIMRRITALLLCAPLLLVAVAVAWAEPKGANGETCTSSATGVSHVINGKTYTCDKCVYSKCDTSGGSISNCQTVTHWSNCTAAARTNPRVPIERAPNSGILRQ